MAIDWSTYTPEDADPTPQVDWSKYTPPDAATTSSATPKDWSKYTPTDSTPPSSTSAQASQTPPIIDPSGLIDKFQNITPEKHPAPKLTPKTEGGEIGDMVNNAIEEQGGMGLSPDTLRSLGYVTPGSTPLSAVTNLPAGAIDLLTRGVQSLGVGVNVASQMMDKIAQASGLSKALGNSSGDFLPGSAVMAGQEAFPLFGEELGGLGAVAGTSRFVTPPHDTLDPAIRAATNEEAAALFAKPGTTAADMQAWAHSHGMTPFPQEELDNALKLRGDAPLPEGVSESDATQAAIAGKKLQLDAANFKGTTNPDPAVVFSTPEQSVAKLEAPLQSQADAFQASRGGPTFDEPLQPTPYIHELSPASNPFDVEQAAQTLSEHGLNAPHFSSDVEMAQAVNDLRRLHGEPPIEPVSYDGEVLSPQSVENPILTKEGAAADFAKQTQTPSPQEWGESLQSAADAFQVNKDIPPVVSGTKDIPTPVPPSVDLAEGSPEDKLATAIQNAKDVHPDLETARKVYRDKQNAELRSIPDNLPVSEKIIRQNQILSRTLEKPSFESIGDNLSNEDKDGLLNQALSHPDVQSFDRANASRGLQKIFSGVLPTRTELGQLSRVFSPETLKPVTERVVMQEKVDSLLRDVSAHPDLSDTEKAGAKVSVEKLLNKEVPAKAEMADLHRTFPASKDRLDDLYNKARLANLPEDKVTAWTNASVLSGVNSLAHNVVGHLISSISNTIAHTISSSIGSAGKAVGLLRGEDVETLESLGDRMRGYMKGVTDPDFFKNIVKSISENKVKGHNENANWTLGTQAPAWASMMERLHTGSFTAFGNAEFSASLHDLAGQQATKEGLTGAERGSRIDEIVANPEPSMVTKAQAESDMVGFRQRGTMTKYLSSFTTMKRYDDYAQRAVRFILQNTARFPGIAEQKLMGVFRNLPGLDRLDPYGKELLTTPRGRQLAYSKYMMSGTVAIAAWQNKDYVLALDKKLNGEWPLLHGAALAIQAIEGTQSLNKRSSGSDIRKAGDSILNAIGEIGNTSLDETYAGEVGKFFNAIAHRKDSIGRDYLGREVNPVVPYSSLQGEVAKIIDPVKRNVNDKSSTQTIINTIKSRTPYVSKSLPEKTPKGGDWSKYTPIG